MSTAVHISLAQYDRMIADGAFSGPQRQRVELIRGEVYPMSPLGSLHEAVVDRLTEWSFRSLRPGTVWVRVQNSIGIPNLASAPEPDIAWVSRRDFSQGRPTAEDVLLIIEMAESSLTYDRGAKAELYAEARIADYWIVDLLKRQVEVHRNPQDGRYQEVLTLSGDDEVSPLAFPATILRPSTLWPA